MKEYSVVTTKRISTPRLDVTKFKISSVCTEIEASVKALTSYVKLNIKFGYIRLVIVKLDQPIIYLN